VLAGVAIGIGVLAVASPAAAHVTVNPSEAPQGSFQKLTFRVPNERPESTISVEVNMPQDVVIPFVSLQPVPGWEATVEMRTLDEPIEGEGDAISEVVSAITWSGGPINPGQFQEFNISAGPLPDDVDQLEFPSIQTYDGGDDPIVRWIEPVPEDGEEPERPVPTLTLTAATGDDHGGSGEDATEGEATGGEAPEGEAAAGAGDSDDDGTDALAIVALVVGAVGVILGGLALARRRTA
jgi:uncharacterized protein YcnI